MSKLTLIGDIVHGEKYQDKETGEDKYRNTPLGTLFQNNEDGSYVVSYLGQWCKVFPKRMKQEGYQKAKEVAQGGSFEEDQIPF